MKDIAENLLLVYCLCWAFWVIFEPKWLDWVWLPVVLVHRGLRLMAGRGKYTDDDRQESPSKFVRSPEQKPDHCPARGEPIFRTLNEGIAHAKANHRAWEVKGCSVCKCFHVIEKP